MFVGWLDECQGHEVGSPASQHHCSLRGTFAEVGGIVTTSDGQPFYYLDIFHASVFRPVQIQIRRNSGFNFLISPNQAVRITPSLFRSTSIGHLASTWSGQRATTSVPPTAHFSLLPPSNPSPKERVASLCVAPQLHHKKWVVVTSPSSWS